MDTAHHDATAATVPSDPREAIALHVRRRGLAPTARRMGIARSTLAGYLAGVVREGTALLVASRADRLLGGEVG